MRGILSFATFAALAAGVGLVVAPAGRLFGQDGNTTSSIVAPRSLEAAQSEAARARQRAAALDRQADAATRASDRAAIQAAALAARLQATETELTQTEAALARAREQRRGLDVGLATEREPLTRLLAGLQTLTRRPALLTLAQPGSIEDAVHLRATVTAIGPQIEARTASLRATLAQARKLERIAQSATDRQQQLQAELAGRRSQLAAVAETERLKARRAAGAADREAERAFAIAEQARSLSELVRGVAPPSTRKGARIGSRAAVISTEGAPASYRLPVRGERAIGDEARDGVTIRPRPGAIVLAPAGGRVAFAGPYRGYGAIVIIDHGAGWTSLVTGLAGARVTVGQTLIGGSPLGEAPSRGPRIGLELRKDGNSIDPIDQLR